MKKVICTVIVLALVVVSVVAVSAQSGGLDVGDLLTCAVVEAPEDGSVRLDCKFSDVVVEPRSPGQRFMQE